MANENDVTQISKTGNPKQEKPVKKASQAEKTSRKSKSKKQVIPQRGNFMTLKHPEPKIEQGL